MKKQTITAIILAKNEEETITKAINSVSFCNEVIVIDDRSTDKTVEIAEKLGAIVMKHEIKGDFTGQRNYAITRASNNWILFLDADEEVTPELQKSCVNVLGIGQYSAYYLKRRDFWWGKELKFGETQKVRNRGIIRLVKKNSGNWMGNVHEVFYTAKSTGTLNGFLNHYPHPTVKDFIQDINMYSSLRAKELHDHGKSTNIAQIIFFPFFKFILNYFIFLGFLDGPAGFAYAFFMSFHSFLVRIKLHQYQLVNYHKNED